MKIKLFTIENDLIRNKLQTRHDLVVYIYDNL